MKADPPGYILSKYECFLISGRRDIPHLRNFNVKLLNNPLLRWKEVRTNEHMDGRTERQKLYTPRYKCRGIIISFFRYFVFLRDVFSSFSRGVISSFRYFVFSRGVISSFRYFFFSRGIIRLFVILCFRLPVLMRSSNLCYDLWKYDLGNIFQNVNDTID